MTDDRGPKEQAYDNAIYPLMSQIIALCRANKINMAAQFALDVSPEDRTMFCTTCIDDADPDHAEGVEHVRELAHVMQPTASTFMMMTVIAPKDSP